MSAKKILVEDHVDRVIMPENLKVGLMVAAHRKKCLELGCPFEYYGLGFGQSPFPVPAPLAEGLAANARRGYYTVPEGIAELREAVVGFNERHFGVAVDAADVIVGAGTKELMHIIFEIIKGDVIIPSPGWIGYAPQIKILDKQFHTISLKPEAGYKIRPDELDAFVAGLDGEQHILVLNNPHNPTGALYDKEELEEVAAVCRRRRVLVLADEIYALTTYDVSRFTSMRTIYPEGTFVTNGLSKDRSAGGYRLGYCLLPEGADYLRADFKKVCAIVYTNVSTPTQYAAVAAYEPNEEIEEYFLVTRNIHRIIGSYMSRRLNALDGVRASAPAGTFYLFADFNELAADLKRKGVATSNDLAHSLIAHPHHIAVVTGEACLLAPDDYGARIAFVDYDGARAIQAYKKKPPASEEEETDFVKRNAPRLAESIGAFERYVADLKSA